MNEIRLFDAGNYQRKINKPDEFVFASRLLMLGVSVFWRLLCLPGVNRKFFDGFTNQLTQFSEWLNEDIQSAYRCISVLAQGEKAWI